MKGNKNAGGETMGEKNVAIPMEGVWKLIGFP